ncbi:MAG TPA: NADH-quinone oxidoreductase subunit K [Candidatus Limnocylindrales bacterium]|nr:NADH-quinone oxidoreductase subunit K [Candidatus Limnocylindrales bacterium]
MNLSALLVIAAAIFAVGCFGLLVRRQLAGMVLSAQLLTLAVVLTLLAFARLRPGPAASRGEAFAFVLALAGVGQSLVGLALAQLVSPLQGDREDEASVRRPG